MCVVYAIEYAQVFMHVLCIMILYIIMFLFCSFNRKRWKALGNLSKEDAQREFIKLLQTVSGGNLREWIEQKREEKRLAGYITAHH